MLDDYGKSVVLIVDDSPTNLSVLSQTLREIDLDVRVAIDGESALAQVAAETPKLILLDIQMPGIDGFETCVRLQSDPKTKDVPVIFITANHGTENIVKGLSLGAVDYITKPFQKEEVLARVKVHLSIHCLTQKVQEQTVALQLGNQQLELTNQQLELANRQLEQLANLDGLTQVANRRRFDDRLQYEWLRLTREQTPLSLILCDIDYFKNYNDFYGHQSGDFCLKEVAQTIAKCANRSADLVARYGGEEFVMILPNTDFNGATQVAASIQSAVERLWIPHAASAASPYVTVSSGVVTQIPVQHVEPTSLVTAADKALYEAKKRGRNTFHSFTEMLSV